MLYRTHSTLQLIILNEHVNQLLKRIPASVLKIRELASFSIIIAIFISSKPYCQSVSFCVNSTYSFVTQLYSCSWACPIKFFIVILAFFAIYLSKFTQSLLWLLLLFLFIFTFTLSVLRNAYWPLVASVNENVLSIHDQSKQ